MQDLERGIATLAQCIGHGMSRIPQQYSLPICVMESATEHLSIEPIVQSIITSYNKHNEHIIYKTLREKLMVGSKKKNHYIFIYYAELVLYIFIMLII